MGSGSTGIVLIVAGTCELCFKKTREQEEKDERNAAIANAAKVTDYKVMTVLFSMPLSVMHFRSKM